MKIRNAQQYRAALDARDDYAEALLRYGPSYGRASYGPRASWQDAVRLDADIAVYELDHAENHSKRDRRTPRGF